MIKYLRKVVGAETPATPEMATQQEETSKMENENLEANTAEVALQAAVASLTSQLAEANEKIVELNAIVEQATEFKAAQEKAAFEAKMAARESMLTEAVGTAQATALMTATAGMDDASFSAVIAALGVKTETESKTEMFTEQGVDGKADASQAAQEANGVMGLLKQWHQADSK